MLFDLEEKRRRWERIPTGVYVAGFAGAFLISVLVSLTVLRGQENLPQAMAGIAFSLVTGIYGTFFFRSEFSKEDVAKTFLNSLLLALVIFLVSGFLLMFAVLLGPHIARGFRIKAMKLLLSGFQQVITTYLLTSPGIFSLLAIGRLFVKK